MKKCEGMICDINTIDENGKRYNSYHVWVAMFDRCYNEDNYRYKWYGKEGVTICKEWFLYSNFKKWYDENYIDGYEIDKDILCEKLNISPKIYSPQTCMFISKSENIAIRNKTHKKFGKENHFYGKTHTEETRKRISEANKGKKRSKEAIEKTLATRAKNKDKYLIKRGMDCSIAKPMEHYETTPTLKSGFRKTCKRKGWNFEDFKEVFAEYHVSEKGRKTPKYFYFLNGGKNEEIL